MKLLGKEIGGMQLTVRAQVWWLHRQAQQENLDDRGDINGYVFVTLMTAGVVMVVWGVARDRLVEIFNSALSSVTP